MARPRLSCPPFSHNPDSTGPVNHHLQKQSHPGPQHKSNQLNRMGMYADALTLRRNPGQEAIFQSKTGQRPQDGGSSHWETFGDTLTNTEDPPAMFHNLLNIIKSPL